MKSSKSSLFLMELILSILFFSLASAACIQLFVKSHLLDRQTTEANHALLLCQDVSEIYLGVVSQDNTADSSLLKDRMLLLMKEDSAFSGIQECSDKMAEVLSEDAEFALQMYYDEDWQSCSFEEGRYQILFTYNGYDEAGDVYEASTGAFRISDGTEIYHLTVSKHIPERMQ